MKDRGTLSSVQVFGLFITLLALATNFFVYLQAFGQTNNGTANPGSKPGGPHPGPKPCPPATHRVGGKCVPNKPGSFKPGPNPQQASANSFRANGTINSVLFVPGNKWIATGNWSMGINNGKAAFFKTDMVWFNNNGTSTHTHQFQNFKPGAVKAITIQPDNSVSLRGNMDVGTNGRIGWHHVPATIHIGGGKIITVSLDDTKTAHHFASQPIYGVVTSMIQCSPNGMPGPNNQVLPTCGPISGTGITQLQTEGFGPQSIPPYFFR